jgi:hypothetical protein
MNEAAPKSAARPQPPEVISTKIITLIVVLIATGVLQSGDLKKYVQRWFMPTEPPVSYDLSVGATTEVDLTVVSADAKRLTCASDKEIEGLHCAIYGDKRKPWPRPTDVIDDNLEHIVQPYRTAANNQLVLVAGLWAEPVIATRIHQEPNETVPVKHQARFTARCKVKVVGKLDEVWLRWDVAQQWYKENNTAVARVESCTIDKKAGKDDKPTSSPDDKPGDNGTH